MKTNRIFVYGTLMEGFSNFNIYLKSITASIEPGYVKGKLYHLFECRCPALMPGDDKVFGELIEFIDESGLELKRIDEFERYIANTVMPMYERSEATVYLENGEELIATAYNFINSAFFHATKTEYIPSGNWREYAIRNGIEK